MSKEIYYCGPQWWPKIIRRWLSQKFNAECKLHDDMYEAGFSRAVSDDDFLKGMLHKAGDDKGDKAIAYVYGNAVKLLGWLSKVPRWLK